MCYSSVESLSAEKVPIICCTLNSIDPSDSCIIGLFYTRPDAFSSEDVFFYNPYFRILSKKLKNINRSRPLPELPNSVVVGKLLFSLLIDNVTQALFEV